MTIPTREEALKALDKLSSDYDLAGGWSPDPMPLLATLRSYIESHTGEPFAFVAQTIGGGEHLLSAHDAKQYVERDANLKPLYLHPPSPVQPVKLEWSGHALIRDGEFFGRVGKCGFKHVWFVMIGDKEAGDYKTIEAAKEALKEAALSTGDK